MKLALAWSCLLLLASCGPKPAPVAPPAPPLEPAEEVAVVAEESTTYYLGTIEFSGAGPTETMASVMQRTVNPTDKTIIEAALFPGDGGNEMVTTTYTQTSENVFAITDDKGGLAGTLTFQGPAWAWTSSDYEFTVVGAPGSVVGHSELGPDSIEAREEYRGGGIQVVTVQKWTVTSEAEFVAKRDELSGGAETGTKIDTPNRADSAVPECWDAIVSYGGMTTCDEISKATLDKLGLAYDTLMDALEARVAAGLDAAARATSASECKVFSTSVNDAMNATSGC